MPAYRGADKNIVLALTGVSSFLTPFMGRTPITPADYPWFLRSARTAFMVFSGLCTLGIGASPARGRLRSNIFPSTPR